MVGSLKGSWLPLALVASAVIALAAWAALAGPVQADANHVTVGSATVEPDGSGTVDITFDGPDGGLAAWTIDVAYDTDVIDVTACDKAFVGDLNVCNFEFADDTVRVTGASTAPVSEGTLATIVFTAIGDEGECSALTISVDQFADADTEETDPTTTDGEVCIEVAATDTPAPTDAPTDAPTAVPTDTPAALPDTGGAPTSGSSNTAAYLLGILGLAAVASGAFVFSRMRRTEI